MSMENQGMDQSTAVEDFISGGVEIVPQDIDPSAGLDNDSQSGITAEVEEINKINGKQPETQNNTTPENQGATNTQPARAQNQQDDIAGMFTKDGNFDVDSFLKFTTPHPEFQNQMKPMAAAQQPIQAAAPAAAPVDPITEFKKREMDYRNNITTNMTSALSVVEKYIQQGYDSASAITLAKRDIESQLSNHFLERDLEERAKFQREIEEKAEKRFKRESMKSERAKVEASIMAEVGGAENLNRLLRNNQFAGDFINLWHDKMRPEKANLSGDAYKAEMDDWMDETFSNINNYRMLVEVSKAIAFYKNKDQLVKAIRENGAAQTRQTAKAIPAQTRPFAQANGRQKAAENTGEDIGSWLKQSSAESFDRIN